MSARLKYLEEKRDEVKKKMAQAKKEGKEYEYKRLYNYWHTLNQEIAELQQK